MAIFRRKDKGILDLTEKYRRDQERAAEMRSELMSSPSSTTDSSSAFGFLGSMASASNSSSNTTESYAPIGESAEEKRRQLSKKLLNLTEKLEDLSNQIYHLQQRIEVLERKAGVGGY